MSAKPKAEENLPAELSIEGIISSAQGLQERVQTQLPEASVLGALAGRVVEDAEMAGERIRKDQGLFGFQRLRIYILVVAFAVSGWWFYSNYIQSRVVTIAVTKSDSDFLVRLVQNSNAKNIEFKYTDGSRQSLAMVRHGEVDMAVAQAGLKIQAPLTTLGVVRQEHILFFKRPGEKPDSERPVVMTFSKDQGSHVIAEEFFDLWDYGDPDWRFEWGNLVNGSMSRIPDDVQCIFVVIDPADREQEHAVETAVHAGFRLSDPDIGIAASYYPYLARITVRPGHYSVAQPHAPVVPMEGISTYTVDNYLVTSPALTDRQMLTVTQALELVRSRSEPTASLLTQSGSDTLNLASTLLGLAMNVFIVLAALFGAEILIERRYVQSLNKRVSCVSLLQADQELTGDLDEETRNERILYLESCADVLGLISVIAGYYGQEKPPLVFSGLTGIVHSRANQLKITIRLKLLNACAS